MLAILSGAYVDGDLRSEFGQIPPVFLPLGNHPLLEWQLEVVTRDLPNERVIVSLPESFSLSESQSSLVERFAVEIVEVPDGLALADSVLFVLNVAGFSDDPLYLLHGDTLITSLPTDPDFIGVSTTQDDYEWHEVGQEFEHADTVWCGYFTFSDARRLVRELATSKGSFVKAVKAYADVRGSINGQVSEWLDCGHLNTFFAAREKFTTQRSFNSLKIGNGIVAKAGEPSAKILSEARWFERLPATLKKYTPAFFERRDDPATYEIEYLPMTPLNELFVHGRNPMSTWHRILDMFGEWLRDAMAVSIPDEPAFFEARRTLIVDKTESRLADFLDASGIDPTARVTYAGVKLPSLREIVREVQEWALEAPSIPGLLHGDPCFSNCVLDSRNARLRLFDPRGLGPSSEFTRRDVMYDVAKFGHSAVGQYDMIVAGAYVLHNELESLSFELEVLASERQLQIGHAFCDWIIPGTPVSGRDSIPQIILLFFSMLPLHSDNRDRQLALFANGLRLYYLFSRGDI